MILQLCLFFSHFVISFTMPSPRRTKSNYDIFEQRQDEVCKQFYLDNHEAISDVMTKLAELSKNKTFRQHQNHTDTTLRFIVQQQHEMYRVMKKMREDIASLKVQQGGHKSVSSCGERMSENPTRSCAARADLLGEETILDYSAIDAHLRQHQKEIKHCILYFWREQVEVSYNRLSTRAETIKYKFSHCRRRKVFTPFIN